MQHLDQSAVGEEFLGLREHLIRDAGPLQHLGREAEQGAVRGGEPRAVDLAITDELPGELVNPGRLRYRIMLRRDEFAARVLGDGEDYQFTRTGRQFQRGELSPGKLNERLHGAR